MKITVNRYELEVIEMNNRMELSTETFYYATAYRALEMYSAICRDADNIKPIIYKNGHIMTSNELVYECNQEYGISPDAYEYINDRTETYTFI